MTRDPNTVFSGSIPENYERYLGPVLFEPYARDLVERLKPRKPRNVLEIACGTGILTRHLRDALGPDLYIVATDLNGAMLDFARTRFARDPHIEWQEADATALPFGEEAFDAVVCQFGLMFAPDKDAVTREAYRVLRPGGAFLFNVWARMKKNAYARIAHETIASFFDRDPPTFYEVPFSMHDARSTRASLKRAGFDAIESTQVTLACSPPSTDEFAVGLVRGNPVATAIEGRGVDIDEVIRAVRDKLTERFNSARKPTMQALVWTAERIPRL